MILWPLILIALLYLSFTNDYPQWMPGDNGLAKVWLLAFVVSSFLLWLIG